MVNTTQAHRYDNDHKVNQVIITSNSIFPFSSFPLFSVPHCGTSSFSFIGFRHGLVNMLICLLVCQSVSQWQQGGKFQVSSSVPIFQCMLARHLNALLSLSFAMEPKKQGAWRQISYTYYYWLLSYWNSNWFGALQKKTTVLFYQSTTVSLTLALQMVFLQSNLNAQNEQSINAAQLWLWTTRVSTCTVHLCLFLAFFMLFLWKSYYTLVESAAIDYRKKK